MTSRVARVALVICDSLGVGSAPDAGTYGDAGANTLAHAAAAAGGVRTPNLERLGLGCVTPVEGLAGTAAPGTAHGRMAERSAGKDSTTGHWEIAGVILGEPFPVFRDGFPPGLIDAFERAIGRGVLGNVAASGTDIIEALGGEHLRTGRPIVYTSADSVFQIACHERVVPVGTLYEWCEAARALLTGPWGVGRVIARPFTGEPGAFVRMPERRDFALAPPGATMLDRCREAGVTTYGVGKIADIFAGRGLDGFRYSRSDDDAVEVALEYLAKAEPALVFVNLVDLDTKYGHRNDAEGYARCLERFDARIPDLLDAVGEGGILFVTGDHGCDPTTDSTDHTREFVPVLAGGGPLGAGPARDLGTRPTFADLGVTVCALLGARADGLAGDSFAGDLVPIE